VEKTLERLTLKQGKFFNSSGREVKAQILEITLAKARNMAGGPIKNTEPAFKDQEIPAKANAFAQGFHFDNNAGAWSNFPSYVAPTIYLRIGRR
jgi:hypothetical protein